MGSLEEIGSENDLVILKQVKTDPSRLLAPEAKSPLSQDGELSMADSGFCLQKLEVNLPKHAQTNRDSKITLANISPDTAGRDTNMVNMQTKTF